MSLLLFIFYLCVCVCERERNLSCSLMIIIATMRDLKHLQKLYTFKLYFNIYYLEIMMCWTYILTVDFFSVISCHDSSSKSKKNIITLQWIVYTLISMLFLNINPYFILQIPLYFGILEEKKIYDHQMSEFRIIHPTKNIISRKEETRKWELMNYLVLGASFFSIRQSDLVSYYNHYTM